MNNNNESIPSSVVDANTQAAGTGQFKLDTVGIIAFLIVIFFVLKSFIYIKDKKRDGK